MKLYDWMKGHKFITGLICFIIFVLQALAVHALHKWNIGIPWFNKIWEPGDFLAYVSGFEAFLGTAFLGLVSLNQSMKADEANRRLSEENNNLQRIMAQKLVPVIQPKTPETRRSENAILPREFPNVHSFLGHKGFLGSLHQDLVVNIDIEDEKPRYKKEMSFYIENVSEAIISYSCIDGITIQSTKNESLLIECANQCSGEKVSSMLRTGEKQRIEVKFYFNSAEIKELWSRVSSGFVVTFYFVNTTVTDVQFHEYMSIEVMDEKCSNVIYGQKSFEAGGKGNA